MRNGCGFSGCGFNVSQLREEVNELVAVQGRFVDFRGEVNVGSPCRGWLLHFLEGLLLCNSIYYSIFIGMLF